jgi:hypothetical protein
MNPAGIPFLRSCSQWLHGLRARAKGEGNDERQSRQQRGELARPFLEGAGDFREEQMKPSDVFNLLGSSPTILRIAPREKRPIVKEWQKLRPGNMSPDYLASFAAGEGIGVSLGEASWSSEGDLLFTLDIDRDDNFLKMLELNPFLVETLQTNGERGGNAWFYLKGLAPPSCKLVQRDGIPFGELRGNGMQTILSGIHPSGKSYTNNGGKPITIEFSQIKWPAHLKQPWLPPEPKEEQSRSRNPSHFW